MVDTVVASCMDKIHNPDPYLLPRNISERDRLETQHRYLKKFIYDGRLIYDRSLTLPECANVLDAGTGTGIWLRELAAELPTSSTLIGIDISRDLFPMGDVPENVRFEVGSVTDLPQEWAGRFDFVNHRLLILGLLAKDWPIVLSQYFRVLKPGGCVQLVEVDPVSKTIDQGPCSAKTISAVEEMMKKAGLVHELGPMLDRMLADAGFVNIRHESKLAPVGAAKGEDGKMGEISNFRSLQTLRDGFIKSGVVEDEKSFEQLVEGTRREWNDAGGIFYVYRIAIAEKPC